jgi:hypothetical protein
MQVIARSERSERRSSLFLSISGYSKSKGGDGFAAFDGS